MPRANDSSSELKLSIRDMNNTDIEQVVLIEHQVQSSPWSGSAFAESLKHAHCCRLVESSAQLLAYHVSALVVDELHILNLAVASSFQGLGLGHYLMQDIVSLAQANQCQRLFLEVRTGNSAAISLYEKWQFRQIALRKQYYRPSAHGGKREDAFVYVREGY